MPQTPQGCSDEDLAKRLKRLRQINLDYDAGRISWDERVRLHQEIVPDIGNLERQTRGRNLGRMSRD